MMMIAIILGTRPEIIKMSPIIRECEKRHIDYFIVHTGQHYSYNMDKIFFDQLGICDARYNLDIGSGMHGEQTAKMICGIENILIKERPDVILVEGDTNTVLAGALAACKLLIKVGHVEAGLRSYDMCMPEEINRILTDNCSDYLFSPTEKSREMLLREGISDKKIFVVGNTIVDAIYQNLKLSKEDTMKKLELKRKEYILVTIHRQENVDNEERFRSIIGGVELVSKELNLPVIYPIHPRSIKMMEKFGLNLINGNIRLIDPLDYLNFIRLEVGAKIILTDSGGIQEEACILNVPCVTMRDNTERPETIDIGSNILAGADSKHILECAKKMICKDDNWKNPFGDGNAARKIVDVLQGDVV